MIQCGHCPESLAGRWLGTLWTGWKTHGTEDHAGRAVCLAKVMLTYSFILSAFLLLSLPVVDSDKHLPHLQHPDSEPGPEAADATARQG